jgi:hypothetical protein
MVTRGDAYRDERGQNGGAAAAERDSARPPTGVMASAYAVRIADRYHLEDRISESGQSALWRAFDDTLGRPVTVRTFGPGVAYAAKVIAAARAACRVQDERLARVFDAHVAADGAYIVTEWADGENLEDLLMLGQLDVGGVTRIVAEAAGALAAAHAAGIAHLHLTPRSVLWSRDAGVKIIGLGIDAALAEVGLSGPGLSGPGLSGPGLSGPGLPGTGLKGAGLPGTGVTGTGLADPEPMEAALPAKISTAILYAGLTGYWPGPQDSVLPAAPRRDGRPYRPRQVRAGVPARIDEITCRALFEPQPRDPPPVTSPGEFAELLRGALRHEQFHSAQTAALSSVTFVDGAVGAGGAGGGGGADGFETAQTGRPPPRSRRRARTLAAGGVLGALFVTGSVLIGMNIMGASHPTHVARQAAHTQRPDIARSHQRPSRLLKPVSAQAFDPYGNGADENSQLAPDAIDNNPSTSWHTFWYTTAHFGNLEAGTGLVVDMGSSVTITSVQVLLGPVPGGNVQLRIGDSTDSLDAMGVAATADDVSGQVSMRPTAPYHGRYVLIWFTQLPPASDGGGVFQADIFNVAVHGS